MAEIIQTDKATLDADAAHSSAFQALMDTMLFSPGPNLVSEETLKKELS
jgi:hypothetical protein